MNKILIAFLLSTPFLFSCEKLNDPELNNDYIIFGHFYGMCQGEECIEIYKLTPDELYESLNDDYAFETFNFSKLDDAEFEKADGLIQRIPQKLRDTESQSFGCPDCADQGGIYLQYVGNGAIKEWRIDQSKSAIPEYLHAVVDDINETIERINS